MAYLGSDKHKLKLWELFAKKQDKLVEGDNITLTPLQDGTVEISTSGGSGNVTDVQLDGSSILDQHGVANIETMTGATAQASGEGGLVPRPASSDKDKFLKGDGTWANASNVGALDDLSDVDASSATDGQALVYDAANQEWVPGTAGGGNVDDVLMNGQSIVSNKIASFNNYVELTQAQYDALPESKLTDGILYCIKDTGIVEGKKFASVIYSLAERKIGVFTDGKPLYQKTISFIASSSITNVLLADYSISNIDKIFVSQGFGILNTNSLVVPIVYYCGNDDYDRWFYTPSTNTFNFRCGSGQYGRYYVTIQYTKTTDVPGSGTYGTDGVPMVHYDGNEKVIGTWFGETLHEKTYMLSSILTLASNSWTDTEFSGSGIAKIIDCKGCSNGVANVALIGSVSSNTNKIQVLNLRSSAANLQYFTIQYTKSS